MIVNFQKKKLSKIIVIVLVIVLALFILNYFRSGVKNFFYLVSSPVQKFFWQLGDGLSEFFTKGSIRKEVINLRLQNQELLNQVSLLQELRKENQDLRTALELQLQKDFKLVLVKIISKSTSENSILIDKGSEDGLVLNAPVINQNRVLFGKISEVYKNFSRVTLPTDNKFVSDVVIQTKEIYGVVRGMGEADLLLDLIPKDSEIKEGDILVTSNLEGVFPKNLLIGEIKTIKKEATKPYQTGEVRPFFDLKNTDNLFVVTNFK